MMGEEGPSPTTLAPSLLSEFLPGYDVRKLHQIDVLASASEVFRALEECDLGAAPAVRILFRLRGLPASARTLKGLIKMGFIPLARRPDEETVLGLVGRFWSWRGDLQSLQATEFVDFEKPGYAKAAVNFMVTPLDAGRARVSTETRVLCTDSRSRLRFRLYWIVIGPFSGYIRKKMLAAIKAAAEG